MEFNPFDQDVRLQGFRIGDLHRVGPRVANADVIDIDVVLQSGLHRWTTGQHRFGWVVERHCNPRPRSAGMKGAHVKSTVHGSTDLLYFGKPPDSPLPAIVDASTASTATNGIVTLEIHGQGVLRVRVVEVATRFPTVGSRFARARRGSHGLDARSGTTRTGRGHRDVDRCRQRRKRSISCTRP